MKKARMSQYFPTVLGILIVVLVMTGTVMVGAILQSSIGYASGYQGAKPSFYGAFYENQGYGGTPFRGTTMAFDPDDPKKGSPNIEGEMTTIFIPEKIVLGELPSWIPYSWSVNLPYMKNPDDAWDWELKDESGNIHSYRMEKWITKWYISLEGGWDSQGFLEFDAEGGKRISNMEIWFELDLSQNNWYFEDSDNVYFAIGKIELANILKQGYKVEAIDVTPEAIGTSLFLFYEPFGADRIVKDYYSYNGKRLNPDLFVPKIYTMINLNDFGTQGWWDGLTWKVQGDVVTFEFTVHQFVIGEWIVKDVQELPTDYERQSKVTTTGFDVLDWILKPNSLLIIGAILIIVVVILIFLSGTASIIGSYMISRVKGGRG